MCFSMNSHMRIPRLRIGESCVTFRAFVFLISAKQGCTPLQHLRNSVFLTKYGFPSTMMRQQREFFKENLIAFRTVIRFVNRVLPLMSLVRGFVCKNFVTNCASISRYARAFMRSLQQRKTKFRFCNRLDFFLICMQE